MTTTDDPALRRRLFNALASERHLAATNEGLKQARDRLQASERELHAARSELERLQRHYLWRVWRQLSAARREPARVLRWPRMAAGLLKRRLGTSTATAHAASCNQTAAALALPARSATPAVAAGLAGEIFPLEVAEDSPAALQALRLGLVSDRFTSGSLAMECQTCDLRPGSWQQQLLQFRPHLVVVESAWQGVDGEWKGRVSEPDAALCALVMSCRHAGIPCVFWNKEDPLHFEAFLRTASLFDHVYTTDAAAVLRYRQRLGHERVSCLPFAVQPRLHHPFHAKDEQRLESSFFAGAWYPNLQERCRDFGELADALMVAGPLVIHDRNGKGGGNNYPAAYAGLVRDAVPYEQTGRLYRNYRIGLTLNTIKQSPTMFARRAMELACTNTSVYSNYSQGLAVVMGDLIRMTDHGPTMMEWAWQELHDPHAPEHRHRRLRALRKVVSEHSWRCRLEAMAQQLLGIDLRQSLPEVAVIAAPHSQNELDRLVLMCQHQSVPARLWIPVSPDLQVPASVGVLSLEQMAQPPAEVFAGQRVSLWHPSDCYGPDYLADLLAACHFDQGQIIGKGCYLQGEGADAQWCNEADEYRVVERLAWRRSIAPASCWTDSLAGVLAQSETGAFTGEDLLSIDRESYACGGECPEISVMSDAGHSQYEIDAGMVRMTEASAGAVPPHLPAGLLMELLSQQLLPAHVSLALKADSLEVVSRLPSGSTAELATPWFASTDVINAAGRVSLRLLAEHSSQYALLLEAADGAGQRLYRWPLLSHTAVTLPDDGRIQACRLVLQLSGNQVSYLAGIARGEDAEPVLMPGSGRLLVVANGYPRRDDLYRNAFIHRRVKLYQQRGIAVDVVWLSDQLHRHSYEYDGVRVQVCDPATLARTLQHSQYLAMAVHFLDPAMWQAIADAAGRVRTVVWVHGAEAQSWTRRAFLYETEEAREQAQQQSEQRMQFWRQVVGNMPAQMQLVFVSHTQAREVQQDLGIELPVQRWQVIHNPIDTGLFRYVPKTPDMRRRILSIRPHASRVYANDLVAATIHELAQRDGFSELTFTLVGDGPLWDENFASLAVYPNVELRRGFVSQQEIKHLHDAHGVFLVPTRADTQGVSRDEAMASGLVPVTTDAGAVREFVDEACGWLTERDSFLGLANTLERLVENPENFLQVSMQAAIHVRRQSGAEEIITRELAGLGLLPFVVARNKNNRDAK